LTVLLKVVYNQTAAGVIAAIAVLPL
jgi:hypothetical protein